MGDELESLDWLDAKLRDEQPYIDDAGFTAQLVAKLPPRRARASSRLRAVILLAAAFIASGITYLLAGPALAEDAAFVFALPPVTALVLALSALLLATFIGGTFALARMRDSRF